MPFFQTLGWKQNVLEILSEAKPPLNLISSQFSKKKSEAKLTEIRESFDLSYLFDFLFKRNSVTFDVPLY